MQKLVIGSRDSQLALIQTRQIAASLQAVAPDLEIEIIEVKAQGDLILDQPLYEIHKQDPNSDVKGLFTKELEQALLDERIDLAVHSMKDLPTVLPEGLEIACTTEREDVRDVLCLSKRAQENGMDSLKNTVTVASSSPRRLAQLRRHYPHLKFQDMRGNLQTRFRKLDESEQIDGIILAAAGIKRLGLEERITEYLDPMVILPAVGQGALAVEIKSSSAKSSELKSLLEKITCPVTQSVIQAERTFLRALDGGCTAPIGIFSDSAAAGLTLQGIYLSLEGDHFAESTVSGSLEDGESMALALAREIKQQFS